MSTPSPCSAAEKAARAATGPGCGRRGLLHAWDDTATEAIIHATRDDAWRVREMAGKVIAAHRVGDAFDAVQALRTDKVPRVRAAAARAVVMLTAEGA